VFMQFLRSCLWTLRFRAVWSQNRAGFEVEVEVAFASESAQIKLAW